MSDSVESGRVNCSIPLMEGEVEIAGEEGRPFWTSGHARVDMRLSPAPRVFIEVDVPAGLAPGLYQTSKPWTVRLPDGPDIEVRTQRYSLGPVESCLVVPVRQPVTCMDAGAVLQSVRFDVLNFPSLFDPGRPAILCDDRWHIEIRPHADLQATKKVLKEEGGYGLTHEGTMRRLDKGTFSVAEAEAALLRLYHFLSFARGARCGFAAIEGADENGDTAWKQWGAYETYPWWHVQSWLDHRHNNDQDLARAYPGFVRTLKEGGYTTQNRAYAALQWYLRSNELSSDPYSAVILTKAALERLAADIFAEEQPKMPRKNWLDSALGRAGVGADIPSSCTALSALQEGNGPKVLADVRNDMIHADANDMLPLEAQLEVHNLGQWYAELLLLWKFGYQGRYANRLKYVYDGHGKPEDVPWA